MVIHADEDHVLNTHAVSIRREIGFGVVADRARSRGIVCGAMVAGTVSRRVPSRGRAVADSLNFVASASVDQLARVIDAMGGLVAGIRDDEWTAQTPCTDWNVRQLVNHFVGGNHMFAAILCGDARTPEELEQFRRDDHLDSDPVGGYRRSGRALLDAFSEPGVLDETFPTPIGVAPGNAVVHLRITELLVHGWDLARATSQPSPFPDDIAEQALQFTRARLPDVPPDRRPVAPPQPVADDAPAIDRLAACLGRRVAGAATT